MRKKIIVATNLWIRFLITKKHQTFKELITSNEITLLFSFPEKTENIKILTY